MKRGKVIGIVQFVLIVSILALFAGCKGGGGGGGTPATDNGNNPTTEDTPATDLQAITAYWKSLANLINSDPSEAQITSWFNSNVADDFAQDGYGKAQTLEEWLGDDEDDGNIKTSVSDIVKVSFSSYSKAYRINLRVTDDSGTEDSTEYMAYNGSKWLWLGNQKWVVVGVEALSCMHVFSSTTNYMTGLSFELGDDESDYAYKRGARSAFVTGPGLPEDGLIFKTNYPNNYNFTIMGTSDNFYYTLGDDDLSTIPDNAEYTFHLCSDNANDLVNDGTEDANVLKIYKATLPKRPLLRTELSPSRFASLTNISSHDMEVLNFGGPITISWNCPAGSISDWMALVYDNLGISYWLDSEDDEIEGINTITIDTTDKPTSDVIGVSIYIIINDADERQYLMGWFFDE